MDIRLSKFEHITRAKDAVELIGKHLPNDWKVVMVDVHQMGFVSITVEPSHSGTFDTWNISKLVAMSTPYNEVNGRTRVTLLNELKLTKFTFHKILNVDTSTGSTGAKIDLEVYVKMFDKDISYSIGSEFKE